MVHSGSLLSSVSPIHALTCLTTILVTTIAIMGQLYRAEKRMHLIEPDAVLVVALVMVAQVMIYAYG